MNFSNWLKPVMVLLMLMLAFMIGRNMGNYEACHKSGGWLTTDRACFFDNITDWVYYPIWYHNQFQQDDSKNYYNTLSEDLKRVMDSINISKK